MCKRGAITLKWINGQEKRRKMKGSVYPLKELQQQKPLWTIPETSLQKWANWKLEGWPADQGACVALFRFHPRTVAEKAHKGVIKKWNVFLQYFHTLITIW